MIKQEGCIRCHRVLIFDGDEGDVPYEITITRGNRIENRYTLCSRCIEFVLEFIEDDSEAMARAIRKEL